ncbi:MAG: hypothetical protein JWO53_1275, partial [Chlamydiia bacterium]|nr:hypothetical protein [Chlamydiia bacterium]
DPHLQPVCLSFQRENEQQASGKEEKRGLDQEEADAGIEEDFPLFLARADLQSEALSASRTGHFIEGQERVLQIKGFKRKDSIVAVIAFLKGDASYESKITTQNIDEVLNFANQYQLPKLLSSCFTILSVAIDRGEETVAMRIALNICAQMSDLQTMSKDDMAVVEKMYGKWKFGKVSSKEIAVELERCVRSSSSSSSPIPAFTKKILLQFVKDKCKKDAAFFKEVVQPLLKEGYETELLEPMLLDYLKIALSDIGKKFAPHFPIDIKDRTLIFFTFLDDEIIKIVKAIQDEGLVTYFKKISLKMPFKWNSLDINSNQTIDKKHLGEYSHTLVTMLKTLPACAFQIEMRLRPQRLDTSVYAHGGYSIPPLSVAEKKVFSKYVVSDALIASCYSGWDRITINQSLLSKLNIEFSDCRKYKIIDDSGIEYMVK